MESPDIISPYILTQQASKTQSVSLDKGKRHGLVDASNVELNVCLA